MIPDFVNINSVWDVLPPGIHSATMQEIEHRFATNAKRKFLFEGIKRGVKELQRAGCTIIFLDGSFVTAKESPNDFDTCWDPTGVDAQLLDPVLLDFGDRSLKQKLKYGGEFFPASAKADGSCTFVEFFQIDRHTGKAKGIIRIDLS
jgi:hypothetical protein